MNDNQEHFEAEIAALKDDIAKAVKAAKADRRERVIIRVLIVAALLLVPITMVLALTHSRTPEPDQQARAAYISGMADLGIDTARATELVTSMCNRVADADGDRLFVAGYLDTWKDKQPEVAALLEKYGPSGWCPDQLDAFGATALIFP